MLLPKGIEENDERCSLRQDATMRMHGFHFYTNPCGSRTSSHVDKPPTFHIKHAFVQYLPPQNPMIDAPSKGLYMLFTSASC